MSDIREHPSIFIEPNPFVVKTEVAAGIAALNHITSSIGHSRIVDKTALEGMGTEVATFQDGQTWAFVLTPHLIVVANPETGTSVRRHPYWGQVGMSFEEIVQNLPSLAEIPFFVKGAVEATDQLVADTKRYASYQFMSDNLLRVLELEYVDIKPGHGVKGAESDGEDRWLLLSEKQEARRMDQLIRLTRKLPEPLRNAQIIKINNGLGLDMQAKIDSLNKQEAYARWLSLH